MALGTTFLPTQKRNDIIKQALLDVHAAKVGEAADGNKLRIGVDRLNAILREEDQDKTGGKRFLTTLTTLSLFLEIGRTIYTATEGLAEDIHEIHSIRWRDALGGERPMDIVSPRQYEMLAKLDTGDPLSIFLRKTADPSDNELLVWPIPRTIGTDDAVADEVIGSDTLNYQCILPHTSSTDRKPVTGTDWKTYWQLGGSSGAAWVDAQAYTSASAIRYMYQRFLFNCDTLDDDPDVPDGWANYLRWRLAEDLSLTFEVKQEERDWIARMITKSTNLLFPSNEAKTSDYHNKTCFF